MDDSEVSGSLGIVTGNPGAFQGYLYPYPPNIHTHAEGMGIHGHGLKALRVGRVRKPVRAGWVGLGSDFNMYIVNYDTNMIVMTLRHRDSIPVGVPPPQSHLHQEKL
jgi:hypothetical protein